MEMRSEDFETAVKLAASVAKRRNIMPVTTHIAILDGALAASDGQITVYAKAPCSRVARAPHGERLMAALAAAGKLALAEVNGSALSAKGGGVKTTLPCVDVDHIPLAAAIDGGAEVPWPDSEQVEWLLSLAAGAKVPWAKSLKRFGRWLAASNGYSLVAFADVEKQAPEEITLTSTHVEFIASLGAPSVVLVKGNTVEFDTDVATVVVPTVSFAWPGVDAFVSIDDRSTPAGSLDHRHALAISTAASIEFAEADAKVALSGDRVTIGETTITHDGAKWSEEPTVLPLGDALALAKAGVSLFAIEGDRRLFVSVDLRIRGVVSLAKPS